MGELARPAERMIEVPLPPAIPPPLKFTTYNSSYARRLLVSAHKAKETWADVRSTLFAVIGPPMATETIGAFVHVAWGRPERVELLHGTPEWMHTCNYLYVKASATEWSWDGGYIFPNNGRYPAPYRECLSWNAGEFTIWDPGQVVSSEQKGQRDATSKVVSNLQEQN